MSDREELAALRRLAELEARAGSASTQSAPQYDPTEGIGPFQAGVIGMGRVGSKVISGIKQLLPGDNSALNAEERGNDEAYARLKAKHPVATGLGESVVYAGVPFSRGILPATAGAGALGAIQHGTAKERLTKGAFDAGTTAVGGVAGNLVGKIIAPVADDMVTASQRGALKAADKVGVRPRLSEVTGSPYFERMEDFAARTTGGAGVMKKFTMENQRAINQTAAKSIGETADELTPKVFDDAASRIGRTFEEIKSLPGRPIEISRDVGDAADEILRMQSKMLANQQDPLLVNLAKQAKTLAKNSGKIDGETYQLIRSGLSEASFDASGTNRALYAKLLKELDNSAEASLKNAGYDDLVSSLKKARAQYANLKTLEKGAIAEGGSVSPTRLASALRTANPTAFREGKMSNNPLYDIGVIGENLRGLRAGSPTYERQTSSSLIDTAMKAPFAYMAAKATTSPLVTAYPRYVGGTQAAKTAAELANPTARALANFLAQRTIPLGPAVPVMTENP